MVWNNVDFDQDQSLYVLNEEARKEDWDGQAFCCWFPSFFKMRGEKGPRRFELHAVPITPLSDILVTMKPDLLET